MKRFYTRILKQTENYLERLLDPKLKTKDKFLLVHNILAKKAHSDFIVLPGPMTWNLNRSWRVLLGHVIYVSVLALLPVPPDFR